jgi:hypothetical protein
MCLREVAVLSSKEQTVLSGFGAAGSILVSIYGLGYLLWFIFRRLDEDRSDDIRKRISSAFPNLDKSRLEIVAITVLIPVLTIPQFWDIFRLRNIQRSLAGTINNA